MLIRVYMCEDDEKTVNKTLHSTGYVIDNVRLKDDTSLLKPKFVLAFHDTVFSPDREITNNYIYCQQWKRYYFIRDIIYSSQSVILDCEIDPLMSHSTELLEQEMFVARQANQSYTPQDGESPKSLGNILLPDDFIPVQANRQLCLVGDGSRKYTNFDAINDLTDGNFVLLVNGDYSAT